MKKTIPMIYGLIITILMTIPLNSNELGLNNVTVFEIRGDYLLHFALFIPLLVLMRFCLNISFIRNPKVALLGLLFGLILAIGTELVQYYLPYRSYNINDVIANVLGVLIGSLVFFIGERKKD